MTIVHATRTRAEYAADAAYGFTAAHVRMQIAQAERRAYVIDQCELDLYIARTLGRYHRGNARVYAIGKAAAQRVKAYLAELGE